MTCQRSRCGLIFSLAIDRSFAFTGAILLIAWAVSLALPSDVFEISALGYFLSFGSVAAFWYRDARGAAQHADKEVTHEPRPAVFD